MSMHATRISLRRTRTTDIIVQYCFQWHCVHVFRFSIRSYISHVCDSDESASFLTRI